MTTRRLLYSALVLLIVLHQDSWNWDRLRWILGLPAGLVYHLLLCVAVSAVMATLIRLDRRGRG